MRTLQPLNIETQIDDLLDGKSPAAQLAKDEKIKFVTKQILLVEKVNGSKVYSALVEGEHIHYNLIPMLGIFRGIDNGSRTYYYPIEYAQIEYNKC